MYKETQERGVSRGARTILEKKKGESRALIASKEELVPMY